jgi:hypothetical protein
VAWQAKKPAIKAVINVINGENGSYLVMKETSSASYCNGINWRICGVSASVVSMAAENGSV